MSKQAINWSIGGMVALSLGLVVWVKMNPKPVPSKPMFASPTAVRPWAESEWDAKINPAVTGSTWKLPVNTMYKGVKELKDQVQFDMVETKDEDYVKAINVVQVDLQSPSSPLILEYISNAYFDGTTVISGHSHRVDAQFYNHQGDLLTATHLDKLGVREYERKPWLYEDSFQWPKVKLKMGLKEGYDDPKWAAPAMFDLNTHVNLTRGMAWTSRGDITFGSTVHAWHDVSLVCTLDLMHGPILESKVPLKKGDQVMLEETQTTFLGAFQGGEGNFSGGSKTSVYYGIDRTKKDRCFIALEVRPVSEGDAFSYIAESQSGEDIDCHVRSANGGIVIVVAHCNPENLKELKAQYRPNRTRFIVPVGKIPGMPKENQGVKDLLDVTIPYFISITDSTRRKKMAAEAAQLTLAGMHTSPKTSIPYYNMTPRELLEDYAVREGVKFDIDDTNWKLQEVPVKP